MTTMQRRIALLTGASLATLGLASPAFAAPHDGLPDGTTATYPGFNTSTDTIEICDLATPPGSPCFFGAIDTTDPALATVPGSFLQQSDTAATVDLLMTNVGSAEVGAIAIATGVAGTATATADMGFDVIRQTAVATTGSATAQIDNEGTLLIDALAIASGTADAIANADIDDAIAQFATVTAAATGVASAIITNNGALTAVASANATAGSFASADADIGAQGIFQGAYNFGVGDANVTLNNGGALNVDANAVAHGTSAVADAFVFEAYYQSATASSGNASVVINNGTAGAIDIDALAVAVATAGNAAADASIETGIYQTAKAVGGTASAVINNDGAIGVNALASAVASGGSGVASASVSGGIIQTVSAAGGDAFAAINNAGTIDIGAVANVAATDTVALFNNDANAHVENGISQAATATGGDAGVSITNDGTINIHATANNVGASAWSANADIDTAIKQFASATGTGNASAGITNNGTINITVDANATATQFAAYASSASVDTGISQVAQASSGDANVSLTGTGSINILANGAASGGSYDYASASVSVGIYQSATADNGGNASATLAQGAINIQAVADAGGGTGSASAYAYNFNAIEQYAAAYGGGDATASMTLGGGNILASAAASAASSYATATASLNNGISQTAYASGGGDAAANFANTGDLSIAAVAVANASTSANATAYVSNGIFQTAEAAGQAGTPAVGGNATATFNNSGNIDVVAQASASGTNADAQATVYSAVYQSAWAHGTGATPVGGNALASLTNDGTIAVDAIARATGTTFATATANVTNAISQGAYGGFFLAGTGGDASAIMTGAGTIDVGAFAHAFATDGTANAYASVSGGVSQYAWSFGGNANAQLSQGAVNIHATAEAGGTLADAHASVDFGIYQSAWATTGSANAAITLGGGDIMAFASVNATDKSGHALASVDTGISQYAFGGGGNDASARLTNTGALTIGAGAHAVADEVATASAFVDGIYQWARATGGGDAFVGLSNAGTLDVVASALATGSTAHALASVSFGISQYASASSGNATASLANAGTIDVVAAAQAIGTRNSGFATASVAVGIGQSAIAPAGTALAAIANDGTINVAAAATADAGSKVVGIGTTATTVYGLASASAGVSVGVSQFASGLFATASLDNVGTINVSAAADAGMNATAGTAIAVAAVGAGVVQSASATGTFTTPTAGGGTATLPGVAFASLNNSGAINVGASANASATGLAGAIGAVSAGVVQVAHGADALADLTNSGDINVAAVANANGGSAQAIGAINVGVVQVADANPVVTGTGTYTTHPTPLSTVTYTYNTAALAGNAVASLTNSGAINVSASANAVATGAASAIAAVGGGVVQVATAGTTPIVTGTAGGVPTATVAFGGNAVAALSNSGTIAVNVAAAASGTSAGAIAAASTGVGQYVGAAAGSASASMINTGNISVAADASAVGTTGAGALAFAGTAMYQNVTGLTAVAFMSNSGSVTATANALAVATGSAVAGAGAIGMGQFVDGVTGSASMVNSGTLNVGAHATASASSSAFASAFALGAWQTVDPLPMNFTNSGVMNVNAAALATASTGAATATAIGYSGFAFGGGTETATIVNSGTMNVSASAVAPGTALALAQGIVLENDATTSVVGTATFTNAQPLAGSIVNSGEINVLAYASGGGTFTTPTGGGGTTTVVLSSATATGIRVTGGVNNMTIDNSGVIDVSAIVENGGNATAYGIVVGTNGDVAPLATDVLTINNSGDILARISNDGGATFHRGQAIDVTAAPNQTVINLLGGNIYGNIDVQAGDEINVTTGETVFNGVINSFCMPAGGPGALTYDNAALSGCGVGAMTISGDGNFHMVIDDVDGPAYAFVDSFTVEPDGTLTLDLPAATGGNAAIGTYPQIYADTVTLNGGTLVANIDSPNGLYETTFYNNVIDGNARTGEFDQCIIAGVPGNSLLLGLDCVYEDGNVDLAFTRAAFDSVPGLNRNGQAVGFGLECIYDVGLTGGIADMLGDLFLISNAANYNVALNQLSGSVYANYLNSFPSLGVHQNDLVDRATNCEVPALAGSILECRASSPIHVWGQLDYQWRKADGDNEAGTSRSKRFTGLLGLDANVGNAAIVGASAGYLTNHVRDNQFGDTAKGDGWTVGAYGAYDPGAFYLKGMTTYSSLNGDSKRRINFAGLGAGTSFTANPNGSPDVNMWTVGLHGGARFPMSASSVVTPYLNLDYVHAKLKGFTEANGNGAGLTVMSSSENRTFLTAGVKWATQMGGVVPEVNLGYRHRFGDERSSFRAYFNGDQDCEFDIVSAAQKRGTFLAGLSVGGKMGPVDLRIGYQGEFNGDVTSHSGNFKFLLPLGGRRAPAPAPVVAPPPPPPPPVVEQAPPPPPPPPPPPAPVERGERGQ